MMTVTLAIHVRCRACHSDLSGRMNHEEFPEVCLSVIPCTVCLSRARMQGGYGVAEARSDEQPEYPG